ncbi:uncharacterized protein LOC132720618 [Ruditapes philippinarum]|uniref:uncharacterized protein LOC132720618 n=1 Tax=Ruditapes philippinarum TaxID=129788 RepID=UPI00295B1B34|nr:uncharacterized protein LOC132720618 [Ruditapes philippinarum]
MVGLKILYVYITGFTVYLHAGTVERIYIRENKPALKGSNIQLVCEISQFSKSDTLYVYKSDSRLPSSFPDIRPMTICFSESFCMTNSIGRYTFSADKINVYINITSVNRSEDQKWWTCSIENQRKDMLVNVITVPVSLQYENPPSQVQDLAQNAVQLKCSTGCSYPQPSLTWYYSESGSDSLQVWSTPGSASDTTTGCSDSERKYSSILSLPRYTTFPGNVKKTVQLKCSILSFTGMSEQLHTDFTTEIQCAERTNVKSFYIGQNESQTVATLEEHDVNIPLTCIVTGISAKELYIIFNGDIIARQSNTNKLEYNVQDVTCTKGGIYICKAVDNFGASTNKTATLFVECSPRPVRQVLHNITSQVGESVTLSFMVIAYPKPGPKGFSWSMEDRLNWVSLLSNEDLQISSSDLETNLTISNVSREQFGKYRVTTINRIGSYDQILFLSEKDFRPDTCNKYNEEKCSFTTTIVLGIVCVVLVGYGTGVSILYKRNTNKKGTTTNARYGFRTGNDNIGNTTNVTEEQDYENNVAEADEDTSKQYTELTHYSNDAATYEPLRV